MNAHQAGAAENEFLILMNLAIRGIDGNLGKENADTFHRDLHPDLKADFILANPPFNVSDWGGERLAGRQEVEGLLVVTGKYATVLEEALTWKTANSPGSPISFGASLTTCYAIFTCAASKAMSFSP